MKVWMCSTGCYSDYIVTAIYSDEATARQVTVAYGWDNEPEEIELDPIVPPEVRQGISHFYVNIAKNGDVRHVGLTSYDADQKDEWHHAKWQPEPYRDWLTVHCWARDKEQAVKIANERRIASLANNTGTAP
jgi:hypothetical protein